MIYISDKKLVEEFFKNINDVDYLLKLLYVASFLVLKFGKRLYLNEVLMKIKSVNEDLYDIILIFKKLNKLSYKNFINIINYLKQIRIDRKKYFNVFSNCESVNNEVEKILNEQFKNIEVEKYVVDKL
jgi:hypothetical protein